MQGKPFEFQMPYSSYVMENVLFKISYPAEFHAQTAVEAAYTIHDKIKGLGMTSEDIKSVRIRTQEAALRIIDKQGPLDNFADREQVYLLWSRRFIASSTYLGGNIATLSTIWLHILSYSVNSRRIASRFHPFSLCYSKPISPLHSTDASASDPRIDALRAKIFCVEDKRFSLDYHDPSKRSIGNALLVTFKDGTILDEVEVEYPVGHKRRRAEGTPLLIDKFKRCVWFDPVVFRGQSALWCCRHISYHFDEAYQKKYVLLKPSIGCHTVSDLHSTSAGFWTLY